MSDKKRSFTEVQEILQEESAHIAEGNRPRVFYHPARGVNGYLTGEEFNPIQVPSGYRVDVSAWEANGRRGPAPVVSAEPVAAEPQS
jgi:hypothetical protein